MATTIEEVRVERKLDQLWTFALRLRVFQAGPNLWTVLEVYTDSTFSAQLMGSADEYVRLFDSSQLRFDHRSADVVCTPPQDPPPESGAELFRSVFGGGGRMYPVQEAPNTCAGGTDDAAGKGSVDGLP